ncbi:MAG: hypothetical protein RIR48_441, partial [Bacteroidota bacterium]
SIKTILFFDINFKDLTIKNRKTDANFQN